MSFNQNGVMQVKSSYSFTETFERLKSNVTSRGLTIFATINFGDDAKTAGLKMNPAKLLIFGNPKAGTPLMIAAPTLAIDFPLKVLVSEDENGVVWLSFNSPQYIQDRHHIPDELMKNISGISAIVELTAK
jgi:uncharacterized protein (DUF302 family)